ncbi:alkaline phosphatase [Paracoccus aerodenitrificans]|uniref:alkaline phosphatase n=1 Tax=Paracoccus aerodenitrificans TaxID=3017781 RepID=UPI0022EFDBC3|nr:alkaline phosphatase [Paracoccus aerodenitrificans]WBU64128.1 alkaline phosphatase [Paracoccus aerodenitrificans]
MLLRIAAATSVGAFLATSALAQVEIAQQDDQWFTDAQARLEELAAVQPNTNRAKNVILFIADGNGIGTNYATRLWVGQQAGGNGEDHVLPQETFPNLALVKTYTTNGQTPDSAPTASAMNTGIKSRNGIINISDAGEYNSCDSAASAGLTTFSEIVSDMGKSVGIVSTARITHATPAAVYAKTANRDWEDNTLLPENCAQKDIAAQLVDAIDAGTVDFAMGGGRRHFLPNGITDDEGDEGRRTDDRNLIEEVEGKGWQYVWNAETAAAADPAQPVLGLFEASHMEYEADRTDEPSLAEMTEMAINNLSNNEDGFYLQVEAGRVDHGNHAGNLSRAVQDGAAFAEAIQKAVEMVNPEETLIVVTADHEHSIAFNGYCGIGSPVTGLCYQIDDNGNEHTEEPNMGLDGKPYTVAGYLNGPGSVLHQEEGENDYTGSRPDLTEEEATNVDYLQQALIPGTDETHSGEDVAVMATGPWAHLFRGVIEQNVIFHVMNKAISAE